MAKKNRNTLKNYFSNGSMPSQEHFVDLIDSMLNVIDEGFEKTPDTGFEIAQLGDSGKLISFFENITVKSPLWSIGMDTSTKNMLFGNASNPHALVLATDQSQHAEAEEIAGRARIGINKKSPEYELDVDGIVAARGRLGLKGEKIIPADGEWHDLTEKLDGCQAFEIMAGVGDKKNGKYALLHAYALNTFNDKKCIKCHPAYYGSRCNQLELRWQGDMHDYTLQLRTKCSYGTKNSASVNVSYYLTQLWFDPYMDDSVPSKKENA